MIRIAAILTAIAFTVPVQASEGQHSHGSKYAGQEQRTIKSLSADDIEELRRGGGWGLAKAAELNGVPGPAHLLQMRDEIPLDAEQVAAITALYEQMKSQAVRQGEKLIALEQALEVHFQNGTITDDILRASLDAIADVRKELRYIHLAAHLETPKLLSRAQIARYNALRGYDRSSCGHVPAGHDPALWRKHNGCD